MSVTQETQDGLWRSQHQRRSPDILKIARDHTERRETRSSCTWQTVRHHVTRDSARRYATEEITRDGVCTRDRRRWHPAVCAFLPRPPPGCRSRCQFTWMWFNHSFVLWLVPVVGGEHPGRQGPQLLDDSEQVLPAPVRSFMSVNFFFLPRGWPPSRVPWRTVLDKVSCRVTWSDQLYPLDYVYCM